MRISRTDASPEALGDGRGRLLLALRRGRARATTTDDYRALVCVFLYGGNDGNNMVVPVDARLRGLRRSSRPRTAVSRSRWTAPPPRSSEGSAAYGLHPILPDLPTLWNDGVLRCSSTSGRCWPRRQANFPRRISVPLPISLMSHQDQQHQWQTALSDQYVAHRLGRTHRRWFPVRPSALRYFHQREPALHRGHLVQPLGPAGGGRRLWTLGLQRLGSGQRPPAGHGRRADVAGAESHRPSDAVRSVAGLVREQAGGSGAGGNGLYGGRALHRPHLEHRASAEAGGAPHRGPVDAGRWPADFFRQPEAVTTPTILSSSGSAALFSDLSPALMAFYQATVQLGVASQVTSFTLSDFGRTLAARLRRRLGPCVGKPPTGHRGSGQGAADVWHLPDASIGGPR